MIKTFGKVSLYVFCITNVILLSVNGFYVYRALQNIHLVENLITTQNFEKGERLLNKLQGNLNITILLMLIELSSALWICIIRPSTNYCIIELNDSSVTFRKLNKLKQPITILLHEITRIELDQNQKGAINLYIICGLEITKLKMGMSIYPIRYFYDAMQERNIPMEISGKIIGLMYMKRTAFKRRLIAMNIVRFFFVMYMIYLWWFMTGIVTQN